MESFNGNADIATVGMAVLLVLMMGAVLRKLYSTRYRTNTKVFNVKTPIIEFRKEL
jgi:hypothetical protein